MLVGFLLVCATVLAKDSGKDTCFPGYTLNPTTKKCDRNSAPCEVEGCDVCEESNPQQCKTCGSGYTLNPTTKKCDRNSAPCEVEGCDVCEESNPQQCKTCGSGYTLNPTTKKCTKNPASDCGVQNCAQCVSGDNTRCETCSPGFDPNDDGTQCTPQADCPIVNCQTCSPDKQTCEECEPGKHLTPTKKACLDACPVGTYLSGQTCAPCDPSCAECSGAGASKCTACPAGKMLRYADESNPTDGTCVEQCVEGPECETCGLTIGGTKYCSKCKGNNVPLNGVCTSNAARTRFCTTAANGACTVCAAGYFIQEGGCYQTTRLPGKSICTTPTGDGKCQTCANGLTAVSNMCPLCDSTCATCTEANQPNKCSACPPGRYLDASKACKLCTETSNNIQGVANCASCAPPSNNQGPVLCYLMKDGGSTNKSGLSTGAIAGISVAVIVVVGGLVGFLCWWFICRGKA